MFDWYVAYIDAGSGSLIIQGAIASVVAAAIFFRQKLTGLVARIRGNPSRSEPPTTVDDAAQGG